VVLRHDRKLVARWGDGWGSRSTDVDLGRTYGKTKPLKESFGCRRSLRDSRRLIERGSVLAIA
jgi:hypothetical protein